MPPNLVAEHDATLKFANIEVNGIPSKADERG
jgi:hypothetical protein